ncbi:ABC transporter permease [Streptomyces sp. NPDC005774]|uniref:ABC transporter permease n=1 Tax=Streptomyces sp. NPDC005774 TaxID=3364728 RepID=UPI00367FDED6
MEPSTTAPPAGGPSPGPAGSPAASGTPGLPGAPQEEDRKTRIGRYVALFAMPFLMVTMMYATYVGTMHAPAPKGMPVAVVGSGQMAEKVVSALDSLPGDPLEPRLVATAGEALDLLKDREVSGAFEIPASGRGEAVIHTASAGGASQASTVQQLLAPVAAENQWQITTEDVAPLPDGDMSGVAVLFAGMGMMLAGYVPLSVLTMSLPFLLTLRRFVPLLIGWAAVTSTVIWTLLGPVVGAVEGHYLEFLGVGMLAVGAVGMTQVLFTKLVGPLAVLFGMLLWVVFGMPASNLALPVHNMPGFFQFLHGVLPLPAAGESLRSLLYFDGRGIGGYLLPLGVWIVVAFVLALLKERRSGTAIPAAPQVTDVSTPLPALAGGPVRSPKVRYFAAVAFPLAILVGVVGSMSASMHQPKLHDMPVVVVAADAGQAEQLAEGLKPQLGAMLDIRTGTSVDEVKDRILEQEVVGAYVLPSTADGTATLYSSSAAGSSQQMALQSVFQQVAAGAEIPLELTDIKPLTSDDTMGSNSMYVGMSWIMAGFLIMAVLRGGAPELTRLRHFVVKLAGWAVGMALWLWFLFDVLIGAVNGHAFELIGFGAVTIFCVSLVTGVFTRTFGLAAIIPVMLVLMLAGVPASGGGMSVYMVPDLFRMLQDVLPLPAAVDTARSLVYFDGHGIGRNLLTIAVWGAAGLVLQFLVDLWLAHRERRAPGTQPGTQPGSDSSGTSGTAGSPVPVSGSTKENDDLEPVPAS